MAQANSTDGPPTKRQRTQATPPPPPSPSAAPSPAAPPGSADAPPLPVNASIAPSPPPASPPPLPPPEDDLQSAPLPPTIDLPPPPPPLPSSSLRSKTNGGLFAPLNNDANEGVDDDQDDKIESAEYWTRQAQQQASVASAASSTDLYLDTVNRSLLDFDFEKVCSVSLSSLNVYACLVCGKYFQGRGRNSYAYLHSIDDAHRVFLNLDTARVYILPDNYEVHSSALNDIKFLLNPTFTQRDIDGLDAPDAKPALDLRGEPYLPGFVGLNNIVKNDYMNVVLQALVHVKPLRDYFLRLSTESVGTSGSTGGRKPTSELVSRFATLVRKIWNPRAFKGQVSPHELLQQVVSASHGRFTLTQQADPVDFLGWLLNTLHLELTGGKRRRESIISRCFQGQVCIESQPKVQVHRDANGEITFNPGLDITSTVSPFFLLALDLPPAPICETDKNQVAQIALSAILAKYNGSVCSYDSATCAVRRLRVSKLPPYLVLHFRRFSSNKFVEERNPTIVNFPTKGLDLGRFCSQNESLPEHKQKKDEKEVEEHAPISTVYDLVANVVHDATPGTVRDNSVWKAQVSTRTDGKPLDTTTPYRSKKDGQKWFQIQDLFVEQINHQMLFLAESYLQIWERRDAPAHIQRQLQSSLSANPTTTTAKSKSKSN
ncbi:cysteine proteinase [Testicularia cyperi]|uniref:Cysteine proteinase n=1 Tax=Testicularia cyperi TaxID=1882483 RepID=A0A317XH43_9BASI|nr:cysteine proteinase [Testicularia cyperi]PWY97576.1 cysteine proteinase [Testicularia cyperi]